MICFYSETTIPYLLLYINIYIFSDLNSTPKKKLSQNPWDKI